MRRLSSLGSSLGCAAAVVLATALAGCQGQGQGQGQDAGRGSAGPTRPAGPAVPQLRDVELPDDAPALAALMGRQIQAAQSVRLSADTSTQSTDGGKTASLRLTGAVRRPAGRRPAATLKTVQTGGTEPGVTETIVVDETVYTRVEGAEHAPGKPWLRISRPDLTSTDLGPAKQGFEQVYNESMQAVQEIAAQDDLAALANGEVTESPAAETLDGAQVRRYVGATDTATLADKTGDAQFRELADAGVRSVPWTIWVDTKGLPRRFSMTMSVPDVGTITSNATYSGWGEPLTITPPPAGQVASLAG